MGSLEVSTEYLFFLEIRNQLSRFILSIETMYIEYFSKFLFQFTNSVPLDSGVEFSDSYEIFLCL